METVSFKALSKRILQGNHQGNPKETRELIEVKPLGNQNGNQTQRQSPPPISRPSPSAWLENGELRTAGHIADLPGSICELTEDNLPLQRTLLQRHCEAYDRNHFWVLAEEWEERAAIMQHEGGMERCKAETEAARRLNLLAYLDDLQAKGEIAA